MLAALTFIAITFALDMCGPSPREYAAISFCESRGWQLTEWHDTEEPDMGYLNRCNAGWGLCSHHTNVQCCDGGDLGCKTL